MARIVLFENIHPSAREVFQAAGYDEIITHVLALAPESLREAVRGAEVLCIRSRTQIDAELIASNSDLRAIGRFCIGTHQVDLDSVLKHGSAAFYSLLL